MMVDSSPWKLSAVATRTESFRLSLLTSGCEANLPPASSCTVLQSPLCSHNSDDKVHENVRE